MSSIRIIQGDCIEIMKTLPECSVDSVVTDPPYGIGFMGKSWDHADILKRVERQAAKPNQCPQPNGAPRKNPRRAPAEEAGSYDLSPKGMRAFQEFSEDWAREAFRVLKPGGHLLSFSSTRTYHRLVCGIEAAGFEIRDQIGWLFGSGFPKSLDVSKAIDKARDDSADIVRITAFMADAAERAGVTRSDVDAAMGTSDMAGWWLTRLQHRCQCPKWDQWMKLKALLRLGDEMDAEVWRLNGRKGEPGNERLDREVSGPAGNDVFQPTQRVINPGTPVTEAARQWQGWGTALKPAWEPICVARKPLVGTVAANVLQFGSGALNIDGCRVPTTDKLGGGAENADQKGNDGWARPWMEDEAARDAHASRVRANVARAEELGRWPANVIHDGSEEVAAAFPNSASPWIGNPGQGAKGGAMFGGGEQNAVGKPEYPDAGSAARFFYSAKASAHDRHEGAGKNTHPTVKPTDLMRYLCRLVTPPGGTVLDPFAGSGSTLKAAELEGFNAIGIELSPEYIEIARRRIAADAPLFADVETA
ncbi:DNA-methyltransferase [Caldimonas brevitalea]|uniref:Adenine-specific methyltransferase n=1 Tax=Caldimonas brevitalea TaxID=413882 RepID=A0A0G3BQK5_9BURK|nr:DNA methyltransferase [Caldimonas brevitalea]AKJ28785.1 adenine-specific methyltransferase [Caldimonas brevitalea]